MSTTRPFFVLPLIATALLVPSAHAASHDSPSEKQKSATVAPKPTFKKKKHPRKHVTRHHHAHGKFVPQVVQHRGYLYGASTGNAACDFCRALSPVPSVTRLVRPVGPPDFADAWYARARMAWVGPTRCYPFQPNGFYPSPNFSNLRELPAASPDEEVEVIGGDYGK